MPDKPLKYLNKVVFQMSPCRGSSQKCKGNIFLHAHITGCGVRCHMTRSLQVKMARCLQIEEEIEHRLRIGKKRKGGEMETPQIHFQKF